jgi:aryl-alcohol dehydrogenase-like predicted oxidoreductase
MGYGVTNVHGAVPEEQIVQMLLSMASALPDTMIDTAPAYGQSESVLGRCLKRSGIRAVVVTKTRPQEHEVREAFFGSLANLQLDRVYGLLDHNASNLLGAQGDAVYAEMKSLREEGLVERIGASVYNAEQLDVLIARYDIDLIQLPFSLLDQRLAVSGHLRRLKALGIEIHARSVFLQGVLLTEPGKQPEHLRELERPIRILFERARDAGVSPLKAALGFVLAQSEIDRVVVGATSVAEFEEILAAAEPCVLENSEALAINERRLVDPSLWMQ